MPDDRDVLTVASFNLRYDTTRDGRNQWRWRRRAAAELIGSWGADVVALQEVLPAQRRYLQRALPELEWYGLGRADGDQDGEQSPIALRTATFHAHTRQTRWLSSTPEQVGSLGWDARIPRVATIVVGRQERPGPDLEVGIVSTHFDHKGAEARVGAARLIADLVVRDPERDWIVMGDLNAGPDSDVLGVLHDHGLRSVLPESAGGTLHGWSGRRDGARIDHVLISERWEVEDSWVDYTRPEDRLASDHWPVLARLRRTTSGADRASDGADEVR